MGKYFLIFEDDESAKRRLKLLLGHPGFEILFADNSEQVFDYFAEYGEKIFAMSLDLKAETGLQGDELAREIRKRRGNRFPIIVVSAFVNDQYLQALSYEDITRHLHKDLADETIRSQIRAFLREIDYAPDSALIWKNSFDEIDFSVPFITVTMIPAQKKITVDVIDSEHDETLIFNKSVRLTSQEFSILEHLFRNSGRICTYESIRDYLYEIELMWADDELESDTDEDPFFDTDKMKNRLQQRIRRIRAKLVAAGTYAEKSEGKFKETSHIKEGQIIKNWQGGFKDGGYKVENVQAG